MRNPTILETLTREWTQRGWALCDLQSFRMEGEGGTGSGGSGTGTGEGQGGTGSGGAGEGGGGTGTGQGEPPKTYTQAEVDRMMTREKNQGKRAGEEAIATQLGVTVEEAKAIIAAAKTKADAEKSEAVKAQEAADAEKASAAAEKAEAAKEKYATRVERALIKAGVDPEDDKKMARLGRLLDLEIDATADDIKAAVDELKTDEPGLFGTTSTNGGGTGKHGDPKGGPPKGGQANEDAYSRGAERAKAMAGPTGYNLPGFPSQ